MLPLPPISQVKLASSLPPAALKLSNWHGTYTDTGSVTTASVDMAMTGVSKMHLEQVNTTTRIGECTK